MESPRYFRFLYKGYTKIPSINLASAQHKRNILWRAIKDVTVIVKKSKSIRKANSLLRREKVDSRELDQESNLTNDGQKIEDQLVIDHKTDQNQSSMRIKLYVKIGSRNKVIVVQAKGYSIIHDIKSKILPFEGIKPDEYFLFYNGNKVEDYRTLASLGIKTESTLHLIFQPKTLLPIRVRTPPGKILKFEVNVLYTVEDVKTIVESFIGCPVSDCKVIYEGNELDDTKSLAFYGVEENANLELQSSWIQIFVRTWRSKTVTLFVRKSSTVKEVKEKLFCKIGMPIIRQGIIFSGKRLEDNRTLSDYNVSKDSTLHMVLWY